MVYLLLTASAFAGQALLFVPIVPLLLSAGALAANGRLQAGWAVVALVAGLAAGDFLWYMLGRRGGGRVLNRVCRIAVEPDTCVRRTENLFGRYGARALLVTKFIPGLSTVALPLAGVFGMRPRRFVTYDVCGVLLWSAAYVAVGYLSARQLAAIGAWPRIPRGRLLALAAVAVAGYFAWKYVHRWRMLRELRIARIDVRELHQRMRSGEEMVIVDLRHPIDFERDPYVIPGAIYLPAEEIDRRGHELPRDGEVVLYCTCPDEVTSAREALRLRRRGIRRVRPLEGGFTAWREHGFDVELRGRVVPPDERVLNAA